jgi:purine-binding chemotaxis protein CheW
MTNTAPIASNGKVSPLSTNGDLAGKYMAFRLASQDYGIAILQVREIIGLVDITRVPCTDSFILGVINLRGKIIPVIDLRLKFGMQPCPATEQTVIIVVQYATTRGEITMGVLVDQVQEVLSLGADHIEPAPSFGVASPSADFILGIGKADQRVIFLLDIGRALSGDTAKAKVPGVTA